jgi:hypothetical protein
MKKDLENADSLRHNHFRTQDIFRKRRSNLNSGRYSIERLHSNHINEIKTNQNKCKKPIKKEKNLLIVQNVINFSILKETKSQKQFSVITKKNLFSIENKDFNNKELCKYETFLKKEKILKIDEDSLKKSRGNDMISEMKVKDINYTVTDEKIYQKLSKLECFFMNRNSFTSKKLINTLKK